MTKISNAAIVIGILQAIMFVSISLYILFIPLPAAFAEKNDLRLYTILTGAYGTWKVIGVFVLWKDSLKNG